VLREAAVLVPVYRDLEGELTLVLIRRSGTGLHGGHIGLPGGKWEPSDSTFLATALREAQEEIGLDPGAVQVIEALERVETRATGFAIAPFLASIRRPDRWRIDPREVEEVLEVRIRDLPQTHGESWEQFEGWSEPRRIPFFRIGEHRLWGATYRIVEPLVPRLLKPEWPIGP
jgi:8-oxo-dGTP pyrophosphatase MutT (NUDIX family)